MRLADLSRIAAELDGVSERKRDGLLDWRYRGRLVARQLDAGHVVIRASFDFRDGSECEILYASRRFPLRL